MILLAGNKVGVKALRYFWRIEAVICYCKETREVAKALNLRILKNLDGIQGKNILSVHGREIVPKKVLDMNDCYNIHPYIVYKGADPIGRAIKNKNKNASVTLHRMTEEVDSGPVVCEVYKTISLSKCRENIYEQLYPLYMACFKAYEELC